MIFLAYWLRTTCNQTTLIAPSHRDHRGPGECPEQGKYLLVKQMMVNEAKHQRDKHDRRLTTNTPHPLAAAEI
jgi:hypothetical protein